MKYLLSFLLFIVFAGFSVKKHDFFVSITDLQIKSDTLQVSIKLFTHDLEEALKASTGQSIFLDHSTDADKAFRTLKNYASERFSAGSAGRKYPLEWIGHEYVDDVTWIYAYAIVDPDSKLLFVRNTLLSDAGHDQHNMVHLTLEGETTSKICTKQRPEVIFSLSGD